MASNAIKGKNQMTIKLIKGINADTGYRTVVFGKLEGFDNNYFNFNFGGQMESIKKLRTTEFKKHCFSQKHKAISDKEIKEFIEFNNVSFLHLAYTDRNSNYFDDCPEALYLTSGCIPSHEPALNSLRDIVNKAMNKVGGLK